MHSFRASKIWLKHDLLWEKHFSKVSFYARKRIQKDKNDRVKRKYLLSFGEWHTLLNRYLITNVMWCEVNKCLASLLWAFLCERAHLFSSSHSFGSFLSNFALHFSLAVSLQALKHSTHFQCHQHFWMYLSVAFLTRKVDFFSLILFK